MSEPHHKIQERDEFPKGVGNVQGEDVVSIIVSENLARKIESHYLKPRKLELAGPMIFGEDDVPSYIIGVIR